MYLSKISVFLPSTLNVLFSEEEFWKYKNLHFRGRVAFFRKKAYTHGLWFKKTRRTKYSLSSSWLCSPNSLRLSDIESVGLTTIRNIVPKTWLLPIWTRTKHLELKQILSEKIHKQTSGKQILLPVNEQTFWDGLNKLLCLKICTAEG